MNRKIFDKESIRKFTAVLVVFLLGSWIASCEGFAGGIDGSCTVNSDCASGYFCRGPNQPNACGIPPRELCASDTDCGMGTVCHAVFDPCSTDGLGSECNAPCTANSCGTNLRCNAGGACEPIPCDEGFTCPTHQKCDSAAAHAGGPIFNRTSGCVNIDCKADKDCPSEKTCVTGFCQDAAGKCTEDIAVP